MMWGEVLFVVAIFVVVLIADFIGFVIREHRYARHHKKLREEWNALHAKQNDRRDHG